MNSKRLGLFTAVSLVVRGIAWGLDGTALIVGAALLAVHHIKLGHEQLAAGFLVFAAGQTLVVSGSAMQLERALAFGPRDWGWSVLRRQC